MSFFGPLYYTELTRTKIKYSYDGFTKNPAGRGQFKDPVVAHEDVFANHREYSPPQIISPLFAEGLGGSVMPMGASSMSP